MTPLEIDIMLHYYARGVDYRDGDFSAPAVKEAISSFVSVGLLEHCRTGPPPGCPEKEYDITAMGNAYVEALIRVPLPEQRWIIPEADGA